MTDRPDLDLGPIALRWAASSQGLFRPLDGPGSADDVMESLTIGNDDDGQDLTFVAHAYVDIPLLVAEVRYLREERAELLAANRVLEAAL